MKKLTVRTRKSLKACSLLILLFILCLKADAQFDPMFTQYMNNELFINPAYTGTLDMASLNATYRNQWVGIPGAPKTQTFSIHTPVGLKNGIGLSMMNESIGITNQLRIYGNYAFRIKTGDETHLSFGLSGGIINHHEDRNSLILISENDHVFDPIPNVIVPNSAFGMYYYSTRFYVGFSIPRLIKNTVDASGTQNTVSMKDWHIYLTSAVVKDVSDNLQLKPSLMIKQVYGAPVEGELSLQALVNNFWWIGGAYRTGDSFSVITGFQLSPQIRIFYSYDYALSKLVTYTSGSHEISLGYDFSGKTKKVISPRFF